MSAIHGVEIAPLGRIPDERGALYHMFRADEEALSDLARSISRWSIQA